MYAHMDAANVDLKAFTEDFYRHVCGAHLADVLDTLEYLVHDTDVWVEITTLLIPGRNDARRGDRRDDAVDRRAPRPRRAVALHRVPSRLQDDWTSDRRRPSTLTRAREIARRERRALRVHGQRARHRRRQHALHRVRTRLIERDWYRLGRYHLTDDGHCRSCGTPLPGRFDGPAGTWGARRLPVRIGGGVTRPVTRPRAGGRRHVLPGACRCARARPSTACSRPRRARPARRAEGHRRPPRRLPVLGSDRRERVRALAPRARTIRRSCCSVPRTASALDGLAAPAATSFRTPLGDIPSTPTRARDRRGTARASWSTTGRTPANTASRCTSRSSSARSTRSSAAPRRRPPDAETVAAVLDAVWGGPETLIVVSTDLSHYEPHDRRDRARHPYGRRDPRGPRRGDRPARRVRPVPVARAGARGGPPRPTPGAAGSPHVR